jgi:Ca2+-binding EF-hand superfamily protein
MMLGYVEYSAATGLGKMATGLGENLELIFRQLDRDKNGKLTGDELPANWKERLLKLDADNDGAVTLEEIQQGIRRRRRE